MHELLTKYYLRLALLVALSAAALWALVALFGFTGLEAAGADATAAALGLVICFLVAFLAVVLGCGVYDVWRGAEAETALETALWAAPVQRERIGFVLMCGGLLLLVSAATGSIAQPGWPAISALLLFGGGGVLVVSALRDDLGPDRPFHQHLRKKAQQRREAEKREAEKRKAEERAAEEQKSEADDDESNGGDENHDADERDGAAPDTDREAEANEDSEGEQAPAGEAEEPESTRQADARKKAEEE